MKDQHPGRTSLKCSVFSGQMEQNVKLLSFMRTGLGIDRAPTANHRVLPFLAAQPLNPEP